MLNYLIKMSQFLSDKTIKERQRSTDSESVIGARSEDEFSDSQNF